MQKIHFFRKFQNPLVIIALLIMIGGIFAYSKMKVELLPNVTFPKIKIIADNGEQPVESMLIGVTQPLEEAIRKSENLQMLQSTTSRGSCEISAFFKWGSDIDLARQQVESGINEVRPDLPSGVRIEIEKMNPSILAAAGFSLEGDLSTIELKKVALFTVKPYLEQISGVRQVVVSGGRNKEYQVVLNTAKMSQLGITPVMVNEVLAKTNSIKSNGYTNDNNRLYLTLTDATVHHLEELENCVVRSNNNGVILLKDIASIKIEGQLEYLKIKANGKDVPLIAIMKQPEANLEDVNAQLQIRLKELNNRMLPKGLVIRPYYNQADFVDDAINSIRDVLWIGLLLAIVVTVLFLHSFKSSLILLISVPLSLLLTIIVMYSLGFNFNIMTLGAIAAAIGLVIDDAVVVVEQIHRTHEEHPDTNYRTIVPKAINYLFPAMLGSSLSTLVIFIPFGLMTGVAGAYFNIMTKTMMITLASSFFVSWLLIPPFYLLLFGHTREKKLKPVAVSPKSWVLFFVKRPYIAIAFTLMLIASMVVIFPKLPTGFLPEMDEGAIVLDFDSPPGTSLEATEEMLFQVDAIIEKMPEVESYSRRTGTQMGFFITEPSRGDYLIKLKKNRDKNTEEVIDEIRKQIEEKLPALIVDFGQVIGDMLGDLMSSVQPIEIKLFGNNEQEIHEYSKKIANAIETVAGTADVFDGIVIAGPSIVFHPKYDQLEKFGLSIDDFQLQMQSQISGIISGNVQEDLQFCDVRMIYPGRDQLNYEKLKKAKLFLPSGEQVPIERFANIEIIKGSAEINRENLKKVGYITARLNHRDLGSALADIQKTVEQNVKLPYGLSIEYGGAFKDQQKAFSELLLILIMAAMLVFTLLLFLYRKIKVALLLIFLILLAPAGSAILLYFLNVPLNVGSYIGIIMVIGIVGEAAIFTYLQYTEERKKGEDVLQSIIFSISIRLRPKLMTALSAIVALLPLALGLGSGAQMHQSLAISVIGGLIVALPILLIALPSYLKMIEK
ncbi:MAG: efflux RND transporter permease subunit [Prolixibacteraceae bacterium]